MLTPLLQLLSREEKKIESAACIPCQASGLGASKTKVDKESADARKETRNDVETLKISRSGVVPGYREMTSSIFRY